MQVLIGLDTPNYHPTVTVTTLINRSGLTNDNDADATTIIKDNHDQRKIYSIVLHPALSHNSLFVLSGNGFISTCDNRHFLTRRVIKNGKRNSIKCGWKIFLNAQNSHFYTLIHHM